jgi:periplasmic protein TonB
VKFRSPDHQVPGRAAGLVGTIAVHAAAASLLFAGVKPSKASPPSYAVDLVAASAITKQRLPHEALPTPPPEAKPEPPKPTPPKPKAPVEKPAPVKPTPPKPVKTPPAPVPKTQAPPEKDREPPPKTASPVAPAPGVTPSTGTDVATIKTPGLEFPYPEYLRNIVSQVYQRWDRGSAKESRFAEISFMVLRDGSVRDIRFVTHSGSFAFDLDAQGAIEAAGNVRAFGPLPDGWEADVLPVSFYFQPIQ